MNKEAIRKSISKTFAGWFGIFMSAAIGSAGNYVGHKLAEHIASKHEEKNKNKIGF